MDKNVVYCLGQDIASISSGINLVKGTFDGTNIIIQSLYENAYKIENNFLSRYDNAKKLCYESLNLSHNYGVDLIVNEDYINSSFSHVAFSLGEFNGIVRAFHYNKGFPMLLNSPVRIRSFIADGRKIPKGPDGKKALIEWCKTDFNYVSNRKLQKERSDCSDAFLHAVMGIYTLFFLQGLPLNFISTSRQKIYMKPDKNGILDNIPKFFLNTDNFKFTNKIS